MTSSFWQEIWTWSRSWSLAFSMNSRCVTSASCIFSLEFIFTWIGGPTPLPYIYKAILKPFCNNLACVIANPSKPRSIQRPHLEAFGGGTWWAFAWHEGNSVLRGGKVATILDLAFVVSVVNWFMSKPHPMYWMALKQIMWYLEGTLDMRLHIGGEHINKNVILIQIGLVMWKIIDLPSKTFFFWRGDRIME